MAFVVFPVPLYALVSSLKVICTEILDDTLSAALNSIGFAKNKAPTLRHLNSSNKLLIFSIILFSYYLIKRISRLVMRQPFVC